MRMWVLISLILFFIVPPAQALEAGLRAPYIEIRSDFAGTRLLVFGALDKARGPDQDVAIIVRGPKRHGIVWRKARVAGIWMNYAREDFPELVGFYGLAATRRIDEKITELAFDSGGESEESAGSDFEMALMRLMAEKGLFYDAPDAVEFLGDRLFRAEIVLPATAPIGDYRIGVYLLERGRLSSEQILPLHLDKIGFGQFIFIFANEWPFFYGLAAVLIALAFGWLMSVVFQRLF